METLPYELLQHISSCLLPRSQCRLVMTSQWCYRWLYTDLLRWHAQKNSISIPKCKYLYIRGGNITIMQTNGKLVLYDMTRHQIELIMTNFTKPISINITTGRKEFGIVSCIALIEYYKNITILDDYYKYMDKDVILVYLAYKNPLFRLPYSLKRRICRYLGYTDILNLKATTGLARFTF